MSLETWKVEFYPVPAGKVPKRKALEHSLRKWIGLRERNLKKHGLGQNSGVIVDPGVAEFPINCHTCALCHHFLKDDVKCGDCPILRDGGQPCDSAPWFEVSPYHQFRTNHDPEPMIRLLRKALKKHESHAVGKGKVLGNK